MAGMSVKRITALASTLAVFALSAGLMAWMTAKVAEHPGVPREVGELPPWFAGKPGAMAMRKAGEHPPAAHPPAASASRITAAADFQPARRPGVVLAVARAPGITAATDGAFVEAPGGEVKIALAEYEMKPSRIRAKPGTVVFVLRNEGRFSHDFHVEGPGVDAYAAKFSPGRTVRLEVTLQEGEYKISCPLSNHDERGMSGTLIATSRLAAK